MDSKSSIVSVSLAHNLEQRVQRHTRMDLINRHLHIGQNTVLAASAGRAGVGDLRGEGIESGVEERE